MSSVSRSRGTKITLRDARPSDAPFILTLAHKAFLAYGSYDRYLEDWFENDAVLTEMAELDGRPAGFFMLTTYPDPDRPHVQVADLVAIAVKPEFQSRGVGGRLLDRALERAEASEPPVREVWLVVAEHNQRAQRLFLGRGFRRGEGVGVYPAGQRALRMVKPMRRNRP